MTNQLDRDIAAVIAVDPLASAELFTGSTVEDSSLGFMAGIAMIQGKASTMRRLLRERGDVWDGMPVGEYRAVVEGYGFELALELPFSHTDPWGKERAETLFIYAHPDGLLLKFDTYEGERVNSGNVYYCWEGELPAGELITSSGHWLKPDYRVWAGDHDCREAVLFNLDRLRSHGSFVSPWPARPSLWLLNYSDTKQAGCDYAAINDERIAMLPDWVQNFIGGAA